MNGRCGGRCAAPGAASVWVRPASACRYADEERHARPAPVVDREPQRDIGLGRRSCGATPSISTGSRRTGRGRSAGDRRPPSPRTRRLLGVLEAGARDRPSAGGAIAAIPAIDLHQVVDDNVTQRARPGHRSGPGDPETPRLSAIVDLHRRDERVAIPDRLRASSWRSAGTGSRRGRACAQEVVDPVDLWLVQVLVQLGGQCLGRCEVVAERRFSITTRRPPCTSSASGQTPATTVANSDGGVSR